MPAISQPQIRACYEAAKAIHFHDHSRQLAVQNIVTQTDMNAASADYYTGNIVCLFLGRLYKKTMNQLGTRSILKWIEQDFETDTQRKAATTILEHVQYYSELKSGAPQKQIKQAAEEALGRLNTQTHADGDSLRADFETVIDEALQGDTETRRQRLAAATEKPASYIQSIRAYKRNQDVVTEVLNRAAGKCEYCKQIAPFITVNGRPYLEVHHVVPLAKNGLDTVENAKAVCPNCHREAHLGKNKEKFQ